MQSKERNNYVDALKAIAAIFVVLIHCMFPGKTGFIFRALARFAVPFFFMVSGYFLWNKDKSKMNDSIPRKINHLLWIALVSGIGYFVVEMAENAFLSGNSFSLRSFVYSIVSWETILRFFVTNTPVVYMPRWFIYALIYCYFLVLIINMTKVNYRWINRVTVISLILYLLMEYWQDGYSLNVQIGRSDIYITFKNIFLLRAFPWFMLGMGMREQEDKLQNINEKIYYDVVS